MAEASSGFIRMRSLIGDGKFPAPVKLSSAVTAWSVADVERWEMARRRGEPWTARLDFRSLPRWVRQVSRAEGSGPSRRPASTSPSGMKSTLWLA